MSIRVFETRPEVAVPCGCVLGEGAIWDPRSATLYWVDINAEAVWSWRPHSGQEAAFRSVGERVGFVLLSDDPGRVLLGLKSGLAWLDLASGAIRAALRPEPDQPGNRLNDGVVGPDGSVYFGSLNDADREPTGRFYRWTGGEVATGFGPVTKTTNGPAINPAHRRLYATDTSRGEIWRHDLGPDGAVGPGTIFVRFGEGDGHPDGMAVDAEGHLWVCHFRGARITRFDPGGQAVLIVPMPTSQITKLAFGGPDLTTIYATSAARDLDRERDPMAGHVFRFDAGIRGLAPAFTALG